MACGGVRWRAVVCGGVRWRAVACGSLILSFRMWPVRLIYGFMTFRRFSGSAERCGADNDYTLDFLSPSALASPSPNGNTGAPALPQMPGADRSSSGLQAHL